MFEEPAIWCKSVSFLLVHASLFALPSVSDAIVSKYLRYIPAIIFIQLIFGRVRYTTFVVVAIRGPDSSQNILSTPCCYDSRGVRVVNGSGVCWPALSPLTVRLLSGGPTVLQWMDLTQGFWLRSPSFHCQIRAMANESTLTEFNAFMSAFFPNSLRSDTSMLSSWSLSTLELPSSATEDMLQPGLFENRRLLEGELSTVHSLQFSRTFRVRM